MEFWTAVGIIRKRWYVVVACTVLFAIAAVMVYKEVKPSYQASGSVVVLQTGQPTSHDAIPYNNPWGSTTDFVMLLAPAAGSSSFEHAFYDAGGTGTYTVLAAINNTPTLILTTTAPTAAGAMKSYKILVDVMKQAIVDKQDQFHTPAPARYEGTENISPSHPTELVGSRIKALIVLGALWVLVSLGLVFLVESTSDRAAKTRALSLDEAVDLIDQTPYDLRPAGGGESIDLVVAGPERERDGGVRVTNGAGVGASEASSP